jgi:hypothetical protein
MRQTTPSTREALNAGLGSHPVPESAGSEPDFVSISELPLDTIGSFHRQPEAGRKRAALSMPAIAPPLQEAPQWFLDLTAANVTLNSLIAAVFDRTLANLNAASLVEAEALLNEMARDPEAAKLITARLKDISLNAINRRLTSVGDDA